jgi:hypothetical protein
MTLMTAMTAENLMGQMTDPDPDTIAAIAAIAAYGFTLEDFVIGFLTNYSVALPVWHSMMLQAVAENKTRPHTIMVYEAENYRRGIKFNYSDLCPALSLAKSAQCAQLAAKILADSASYLQDFEEVYLPACERNRPDSNLILLTFRTGRRYIKHGWTTMWASAKLRATFTISE